MRHLRLGVRLQGGSNSLPRAVPYLSLGRLGRRGVRLCHYRRGGCAEELGPHHQVKRRTADVADAESRRAPPTAARRATATVWRRASATAVHASSVARGCPIGGDRLQPRPSCRAQGGGRRLRHWPGYQRLLDGRQCQSPRAEQRLRHGDGRLLRGRDRRRLPHQAISCLRRHAGRQRRMVTGPRPRPRLLPRAVHRVMHGHGHRRLRAVRRPLTATGVALCIAAGYAPRTLLPRAPPTAATRAPAAASCWAAPSTSWWASSTVARAPSAARGTPAAAFTRCARTATTTSTFTYRTCQPHAGGFKIFDQGRPRRTAPLQHVQVEAARAGAGWALRVRSSRTYGADTGGVTHANGTELLCSLLRQH